MELLQRQKLVQEQRLSPEQVQYYELLQKPILELQAAIEEELRTNPALEIEEIRRCPICGEILEPGEGCNTCRPGVADKEDRKEIVPEGMLEFLDDIYNSDAGLYEASFYEQPEDEEGRDKFALAIRTYTLADHLKAGLPFADTKLTKTERVMAEDLISMLNDNGFLPQDDENLALELCTTPETIAKLRDVISDIEPAGAALKDPIECMLKQLDIIAARDGRDVEIEREIVKHHLKDAAKEQFAKIAKKLGVSTKIVKGAFQFIRDTLYFCPTSQLDLEGKLERGENIYIEPDIRIYEDEGKLMIELLETGLPQLKLSRFYQEAYHKMKDRRAADFNRDERKHIREHLYKAKRFIEHINTRRETILRIVTWLVEFQEDFIRRGPAHLKPLTRERLANEVGYHPSTVTRALINRYVQFPDNSVKPFSVFFDSSQCVIAEILHILEEENAAKVYSDEEITAKLAKQGNQLSRRAITKYRHAAKIPSSGQRKRALKSKAKTEKQTETPQE